MVAVGVTLKELALLMELKRIMEEERKLVQEQKGLERQPIKDLTVGELKKAMERIDKINRELEEVRIKILLLNLAL